MPTSLTQKVIDFQIQTLAASRIRHAFLLSLIITLTIHFRRWLPGPDQGRSGIHINGPGRAEILSDRTDLYSRPLPRQLLSIGTKIGDLE